MIDLNFQQFMYFYTLEIHLTTLFSEIFCFGDFFCDGTGRTDGIWKDRLFSENIILDRDMGVSLLQKKLNHDIYVAI